MKTMPGSEVKRQENYLKIEKTSTNVRTYIRIRTSNEKFNKVCKVAWRTWFETEPTKAMQPRK